MLANKLGVKENLIIVNQILPTFGTGVAMVHAEAYDSAEAMPHLVDTYKMTRHLPKEEKTKIKDDMKAKRQAAKAAKQAAKKTAGAK
jgi:ribosomal protein S24E